jgi:hypothetical protein
LTETIAETETREINFYRRKTPEGKAMEILVILHTDHGDVRSVYPSHKQAEAIALWKGYVDSGKKATLTTA